MPAPTRARNRSAGWSRAPIDATAMKLVDADAQLKISGLTVSGLKIDKISLRLRLNNGTAQANIDRTELYGGYGRGVITASADAAATGVNVGANVGISDISAEIFLKDAADLELVSGRARFIAELNGSGRSQQAIMSSLAGTASFIFKDGAIVGWNIPQMLRGLRRGKIADLGKTPAAKTDFSEFAANFKINRGIANTQNLRVVSPLLRMPGSGNINIGRRRLDMILRPKLVASLEGQGGKAGLSGIQIPVRVSGPWDNPNAKPDLTRILIDGKVVRGTVEAVSKLTGKLKDKDAGDIVRGLLGDNKNGEDQGNLDLLKGLFKN